MIKLGFDHHETCTGKSDDHTLLDDHDRFEKEIHVNHRSAPFCTFWNSETPVSTARWHGITPCFGCLGRLLEKDVSWGNRCKVRSVSNHTSLGTSNWRCEARGQNFSHLKQPRSARLANQHLSQSRCHSVPILS